MTNIIEIKCDEDVKLAEAEIERLKECISNYKLDKFEAFLATCEYMTIPKGNYEPLASYHYVVGSHLTTGFSTHYDYDSCGQESLPVVDSWKTFKNSKSTTYILYDRIGKWYLKVYLKDSDLGAGSYRIVEHAS